MLVSRGHAMVRTALLLLILATFAASLAQPVQAQAAAGTLYLTGGVTRNSAVVPCDTATAALGTSLPAAETNVYTTRGYGGLGCVMNFDYPVTAATTLNGVITTHLVFGCDLPSASAGVAGATTSFRVTVYNGATAISAASNVVASNACTTTSNIVANVPNTLENDALKAGDILRFQVLAFYLSPGGGEPVPSTYYVAGGADPTRITGPGLPSSGGSTPVVDPNDTDSDGLNDTCEQRYFGNLTATNNSTGDPDGDTVTNAEECQQGTDPTKADTDGDGTNDRNDPFPTDPTQGGSSGNNSTSSTSTTSRSTTTTAGNVTTSRSSTTTAGNVTTTDDSIDSLDEAIEKLRSDIGYLGGSAGAFLAVLVLCILALAVRWSL